MALRENEDRPCFTMCVFQDPDWATKGLEALQKQGFEGDVVSVVAKQTAEVDLMISATLGVDPAHVEIMGLGPSVAVGRLVTVLQGDDDGLGKSGMTGTIRRVGFQAHDGFIYQTLAERGGVLVAVDSESRAADALALFHSYGGGNAAIGAWVGRV